MAPLMIVVAGPAGTGKSTAFPVGDFGVAHFNIDDRCAARHGGYVGIPPALRAEVSRECEAFVATLTAQKTSFAVETTLRSPAALLQARHARSVGFVTVMFFLATDDPAINVERVRRRGLAGGHAASADEVHLIHAASLQNLGTALQEWDVVHCYDATAHGRGPRLVATARTGQVQPEVPVLPGWLRGVLERF